LARPGFDEMKKKKSLTPLDAVNDQTKTIKVLVTTTTVEHAPFTVPGQDLGAREGYPNFAAPKVNPDISLLF
jgi:hypothetical protein